MKKATNISSSFTKTVDWKAKASVRAKQIKALNKRLREMGFSRDNWKGKYMQSKKESVIWKTKLLKFKKKLNEIVN